MAAVCRAVGRRREEEGRLDVSTCGPAHVWKCGCVYVFMCGCVDVSTCAHGVRAAARRVSQVPGLCLSNHW